MKLTLALLTMLLLFIAPAFSELTPADLKEIRAMLNAEITDVKKEIAASEKRMKEHVSQEIGKVDIKISEMDKRLNHIFSLVITLIALIAVVVGVPQIIVAMQRKDIRTQDEKIEALMQEIETLKQERIVRP